MTFKKKPSTSSSSSLGGSDQLINPLDPSHGRPEVDPIPPPEPVQIHLPSKDDEEEPPPVDDEDEPVGGNDGGGEGGDPPPPVGP